MKPSRFREEQIIGILREQEAGAKAADDFASRPSFKSVVTVVILVTGLVTI